MENGRVYMKCSVTIDSCLINREDIEILNSQSKDIFYSDVESSNFFSSEIILILLDIGRNIGYSTAYDMLKYVLSKVIILLKNKKVKHKELQFEISCNGKVFSIKTPNTLTERQMDKLINAAAEALISEWNCKGKLDEKQ